MDIPIVRTTAQIDKQREEERLEKQQQEFDRATRHKELCQKQLERVSDVIKSAMKNNESFVRLYSTELYPDTQKIFEEKGYQCIQHPSNQMFMTRPPSMQVGDVTIFFDYDEKRNTTCRSNRMF